MTRRYLNESHRRHSEALQKAVDEMSKHPQSYEQMKAQCERNRAALEKKHALQEKEKAGK